MVFIIDRRNFRRHVEHCYDMLDAARRSDCDDIVILRIYRVMGFSVNELVTSTL